MDPKRCLDYTKTLFWALLTGLGACTSEIAEPPSDQFTYLYLGHTYQWGSPHEDNRIDHRLEAHDFRQYDGLLLGGDMCSETSKFRHTVTYLDGLFRLSESSTLWSVGNHDIRNGNLNFITDATARPLSYLSDLHGISWLILNTALDDMPDQTDACQMKATQLAMFESVFDTIAPGRDVIIMLHHVVWSNVEAGMHADTAANANKSSFNFACDSVVRFSTHLYPALRDQAATGADVLVLSGDGGQYKKSYEFTTTDGVTFLISGINNSVLGTGFMPERPFNPDPDSVLLIHNDRRHGSISYEFVRLDELID